MSFSGYRAHCSIRSQIEVKFIATDYKTNTSSDSDIVVGRNLFISILIRVSKIVKEINAFTLLTFIHINFYRINNII